jgi:hypothetical protein
LFPYYSMHQKEAQVLRYLYFSARMGHAFW